MSAKWIVDVKGRQGASFEISVVLDSNKFGIESWGWFDENKLLISSSGAGNWGLTKHVWDKMMLLAHEVARELNMGLGQ
jgi:hypothetical protein